MPARPAPRAVVLQPRAHVIRERHVVADDVRLRQGDHVQEHKVSAAVPRLRHAAVVADDEVTRVVGIDPHGVVIHVDALRRVADGLAAVVGEIDGRRGPVHAVGVLGIGAHLGVVEGADVVAVHLGPRRAAVARAVQAGGTRLRRLGFVDARIRRGVRFDQRVDHFGVAARDGEPDAPLQRLGEAAALHLDPRLPAVGRLPQGAARPAALQEVGAAHPLPARGEQHLGVGRVHGNVDEARLVADELDELPGLAAVGRLVEAALGVRAPRPSQGGDVHDVRIGRVHDDAADRPRLLEPHRLPGEPAVGRFENAAARRDGVAGVLFARPRPHLRRVAGGDGQLAHRDAALIVEDRPERDAGVGRLPDPARRARDEKRFRRAGDADHAGGAAAHVGGADVAPAETGEQGRVEGLSGLSGEGAGQGHQDGQARPRAQGHNDGLVTEGLGG